MSERITDGIFVFLCYCAGLAFGFAGVGVPVPRIVLGFSGMIISAGMCALMCRSMRERRSRF